MIPETIPCDKILKKEIIYKAKVIFQQYIRSLAVMSSLNCPLYGS